MTSFTNGDQFLPEQEYVDDPKKLEEALLRIGLDKACISSKLRLYQSGVDSLINMTSSSIETGYFWVPGRIEVVGKHTDYAGGKSLLAATSLGFCVVASRSIDNLSICRVITLDETVPHDQRCVEVDLNANILPPLGHWSRYVYVALLRISKDFPGLHGVNIAIGCDLPKASGMSTSSALVCALFMTIAWSSNLKQRADFLMNIPDECSLCDYLGCVENGSRFNCLEGGGDNSGVGTFGGSEDHTAIMTCSVGTLKMFSFCPTTFIKEYPMANNLVFVIASSGVVAEKTGAAMENYNDASLHARGISNTLGCNHLREVLELYGSISNIGEALKKAKDVVHNYTSEDWVKDMRRVKQFVEESDMIAEGMGVALSSGNHNKIKELSTMSHSLGDVALGNLVEATKWLPRRALHLKAYGSSAFGAGFGGSVWAVVEREMAPTFQQRWADDYRQAFPQYAENAVFFTMRPGPSACRL